MKNYICTIKKLSEIIAKCILKENPCETVFKNISFSVLPCGYDGKTDPEVIASGAEGWYGIRRVDTGFDDDGLTLCANYYGGGTPSFCYIDRDCSDEEIIKMVCLAIQRSLCLESPNINGDTVLIVEDCCEPSPTIAIVMENGAVGSVLCTNKTEKFSVMIVDDNCDDENEWARYKARKEYLIDLITKGQIAVINDYA